MQTALIKDLPKGEFFIRKPDSKKVYQREDYNRAAKKYDCRDGTEGGGLWFERLDDGRLDLVDYDGSFALPNAVIDALRASGVSVEEIFE